MIPLNETHWKLLRPHLIESGVSLLEDCGISQLSVCSEPNPGPVSQTVAVLGFCGDKVRGTLTLFVPWEVLKLTYPQSKGLAPPELSMDDLLDWLGELCNQFTGRFKARAAPGVILNVSTPRTLWGEALQVLHRADAEPCRLQFSRDDWSIVLECEGEIAADVDLGGYRAHAADSLREGDTVIFHQGN